MCERRSVYVGDGGRSCVKMLYQIFNHHFLHRTESLPLLQDVVLNIHINIDMTTVGMVVGKLAMQGISHLDRGCGTTRGGRSNHILVEARPHVTRQVNA